MPKALIRRYLPDPERIREQKSLGFTRYVVLDEGVTMANLRANVEVLMGLLGVAYPVAAGEPVAAEPEAAPAS